MSIKVGLLGFGRTGSLVAKEIVNDSDLELSWVCRNQIPANQKFASHSLGYDKNFAEFVQPTRLNDCFLRSNPVDLVIDFSAGISSIQSEKFFGIDIPTGGKSLREVEEFNIHPNTIKSLQVGKCVCIKKYPESRAYLVDVSP